MSDLEEILGLPIEEQHELANIEGLSHADWIERIKSLKTEDEDIGPTKSDIDQALFTFLKYVNFEAHKHTDNDTYKTLKFVADGVRRYRDNPDCNPWPARPGRSEATNEKFYIQLEHHCLLRYDKGLEHLPLVRNGKKNRYKAVIDKYKLCISPRKLEEDDRTIRNKYLEESIVRVKKTVGQIKPPGADAYEKTFVTIENDDQKYKILVATLANLDLPATVLEATIVNLWKNYKKSESPDFVTEFVTKGISNPMFFSPK